MSVSLLSRRGYAVQVLHVKPSGLQHDLKHIKTHPLFAHCPSFNLTLFDASWLHPWEPFTSSKSLIGRRLDSGELRLAVQNVNQASNVFSGRIGSRVEQRSSKLATWRVRWLPSKQLSGGDVGLKFCLTCEKTSEHFCVLSFISGK